MSSSFSQATDSFLNQFGTQTLNAASRIYQAFMAYSMCLVVEAFRRNGYTVLVQNLPAGNFRFKYSTAGNPSNYSFFLAQKASEAYEIRMNTYCRNMMFRGLRLCLDIVVINRDSIDTDTVDSQRNLIAFSECKNQNGYPELVASFEGLVLQLQYPRLWKGYANNYRLRCCLMLSGHGGNAASQKNSDYTSQGKSLVIFDRLQPGGAGQSIFLQQWF